MPMSPATLWLRVFIVELLAASVYASASDHGDVQGHGHALEGECKPHHELVEVAEPPRYHIADAPSEYSRVIGVYQAAAVVMSEDDEALSGASSTMSTKLVNERYTRWEDQDIKVKFLRRWDDFVDFVSFGKHRVDHSELLPVLYFSNGWKLGINGYPEKPGQDYDLYFAHSVNSSSPPTGAWQTNPRLHTQTTLKLEYWTRDVEGITIARLLLLFIVALVTLLYMVNYRDLQIRLFTYTMLSTVASIFIAVLLNQSIATFILDQFLAGKNGRGLGIDIHTSFVYEVCVGILIFVFAFFFGLSVLGKAISHAQYPERYLPVVSGLCGHISAFACIRAAGNLQQNFCHSQVWAPAIVVLCAIFGYVVRTLSGWMREMEWFDTIAEKTYNLGLYLAICLDRLGKCCSCCCCSCCNVMIWCVKGEDAEDSSQDEDEYQPEDRAKELEIDDEEAWEREERWSEAVTEGELECFDLAVSFLAMQCIMSFSTGELQPMHFSPQQHSWSEIKCAMYFCLGCLICLLLASSMRLKKHFLCRTWCVMMGANMRERIKKFFALTLSWTSLSVVDFLAQRAFKSVAKMQIYTAFDVTFFCILIVVASDRVADAFESQPATCRKGCNRYVEDKKKPCCIQCTGSEGLHDDHCSARSLNVLCAFETKKKANEKKQKYGSTLGFDSESATREESEEQRLRETDLAKSLRVVMEAAAFLTGISWEKAFDLSVRELVDGYEFMRDHWVISKCCIAVLFLCFVTPAWMKYIIPKAVETDQAKSGRYINIIMKPEELDRWFLKESDALNNKIPKQSDYPDQGNERVGLLMTRTETQSSLAGSFHTGAAPHLSGYQVLPALPRSSGVTVTVPSRRVVATE